MIVTIYVGGAENDVRHRDRKEEKNKWTRKNELTMEGKNRTKHLSKELDRSLILKFKLISQIGVEQEVARNLKKNGERTEYTVFNLTQFVA